MVEKLRQEEVEVGDCSRNGKGRINLGAEVKDADQSANTPGEPE
jgi:hypothetical protein